jgi:hypothetical protein
MEATFPLEDDRNRDKRSDAPQASGSRASPLSLCSWRTANGAIAMATKEASGGPSFGDSYATHSGVSPAWRDDCISRTIRKPNSHEAGGSRRTAHRSSWWLPRPPPGEGQRCLPGAGPKADQPVPAVVRCRRAATGRSPGLRVLSVESAGQPA